MESSRQDSSIRSMPVQHRTGCAERGFSHKVQTDSLLLSYYDYDYYYDYCYQYYDIIIKLLSSRVLSYH